jgi:SSS family solute:Na+ symporter
VIGAMGLTGSGWLGDLPLIVAFAILAAYTYTSGLRAPAMIAFVKDAMIYIVTIAAVIAVALKFGGFGPVFAAAHAHFSAAAATIPKPAVTGSVVLGPKGYWAYATLAFGSAFALFLYPHAITGLLSSKSGDVIKRNAILLPAYSLLLGLVALLGFAAIAAGVSGKSPQFAVPGLLIALFPSWFVGFAFAAIAIGALVPAAVMSIAAANLWTRNIYAVYIQRDATPEQQARQAKLASLVVKLGALVFIIFVPTQYAIDLQLLGGIWILQTLPAIVAGLFGRVFHHGALIAGWFVAMLAGTAMSFSQGVKPTFPLSFGAVTVNAYIGLEVLLLNLIVTSVLTVVFDRLRVRRFADKTVAADYDRPATC